MVAWKMPLWELLVHHHAQVARLVQTLEGPPVVNRWAQELLVVVVVEVQGPLIQQVQLELLQSPQHFQLLQGIELELAV